ncbi:MAG TPA: transcription termination/antitermination protein NusG [bacterium]|nr:transcription termination/antitermination protein NusG [bacterium]HOL48135.1 transcription termination/antitermination protein NusG [bacterium]HPQ18541.1 transcription termination/antitermination protein NusG [bacterium]
MAQEIDLKQLFEKFQKKAERQSKEEKVEVKKEEKEADDLFLEELFEKDSKKEWFVIHTYSGQEQKVKDNIEMRLEKKGLKDKIGKIIIPTENVIEIKNGYRREIKRKVFPGYVLIQLETEERMVKGQKKLYVDERVLYEIRSINGVTNFINTGKELLPLPKHEVKAILQKSITRPEKPEASYEVNEVVIIKAGPFTEYSAIIQEVDEERGRVKALVEIFGRNTLIELTFEQIEKEK